MTRCEQEPIHTPGRIQAYGAMLVCDTKLRLAYVSDNAALWLGSEPCEMLGQALVDLLPSIPTVRLQRDLAAAPEGTAIYLSNVLAGAQPAATAAAADKPALAVTATRMGEHLHFELEFDSPAAAKSATNVEGGEGLLEGIHQSAQLLIGSADTASMCDALAQQVRALFGYDRVLIYRFDARWNGTVVAESLAGPLCSYLGHRFPESDIPSQARTVFRLNMQRMIPDAHAATSAMLAASVDAPPVDMTYCHLRAASPVHLQYLDNLRVRASLTLSLRNEGKLWGLVACHHATPRYLSAAKRHSAEMLAMLASAMLGQKERQDGASLRHRLAAVNQALNEQMRSAKDILAAVCDGPVTLLALSQVSRASCAIRLDGHWRTLGDAPDAAMCTELADWLSVRHATDEYFASSCLQEDYPPAAAAVAKASGLLATSLPHSDGSWILWFRPEMLHDVTWAGNPHENKVVDGKDPGRLHPRQSFARYREVVVGRSASIAAEEVDAALSLRKTLIEVDLAHKVQAERRLRAVAEEEQKRAQQAVATREHVLSIVSHDLRNPLNAITLSAQLMHRKLRQSTNENLLLATSKFLQKVDTATLRMRRLIEDVLSLAKIQGGQFQVEQSVVVSQTLLKETQLLLEPIASKAQLTLSIDAPAEDIAVVGDGERLLQALGNLVGNAVKFTPQGGQICLRVERSDDGQEARFCVADSGRGIAPADQAHIFEPFWQASSKQAHLGAGLGLNIVKHIVEAHGGRVWVQSELGRGAQMWFSCPLTGRSDRSPRPAFDQPA